MPTTATAQTARKAHDCDSCFLAGRRRRTIRPGHRYLRHVAFPDGEVNQGPAPVVSRECVGCVGERDDYEPLLVAGACSSFCCGTEPCALPFQRGAPSHNGGEHSCRRCTADQADAEAAEDRWARQVLVDELLATVPV